MIRRPPRSTQSRSSAASDVYKRQPLPRSPAPGESPPQDHQPCRYGGRGYHRDEYVVGRNHPSLLPAGERAVEPARAHRVEDPFSAPLASQEQGARHAADDASLPQPTPVGVPGGAGAPHSLRFVDNNEDVSVHEGGGGGEEVRGVQAVSYTHLTLPTIY